MPVPSPWSWRWPAPPAQAATCPDPKRLDRRPCGCTLDPVVFGHTAWNGHRYPAEGAA